MSYIQHDFVYWVVISCSFATVAGSRRINRLSELLILKLIGLEQNWVGHTDTTQHDRTFSLYKICNIFDSISCKQFSCNNQHDLPLWITRCCMIAQDFEWHQWGQVNKESTTDAPLGCTTDQLQPYSWQLYLVSPFVKDFEEHGCASLGVSITRGVTRTRVVSPWRFKDFNKLCHERKPKQVEAVCKYEHKDHAGGRAGVFSVPPRPPT